jgi:polyferredoxin
MHWIRRVFQIGVLVAAAVTGYRYAMGWTRITVETFCPFGGLEAMFSLVSDKYFPCATGERNLMLFAALVLLTIVSRRVFCSWICPVGTVSEGLLHLARKRGIGTHQSGGASGIPVSRAWDSRLRWLRFPILLGILLLTFYTGELIFRSVDPYYILFSFHGHDVFWWSYIVIGVILVTIFIIPMAWCRYLCPLGGALWPVSRFGLLRLHRGKTCIDCRKCDAVCPQGIAVSSADSIVSGECTLCLECRRTCPVDGVLELRIPGGCAS